ncbi:MAG: calcium/sodium antiporter [Gammaproteobacteria bacterium]|nr:calcium/sodium antiporter [Gammaproteobacteria bacterium]
MISLLGIILGLVILVAGGAALVYGASQAATRLGISPMIVGLTVVSIGTSAPELIVNLTGAFRGETGLAFGNVVGSNIANIGLVLGLAAIVRPIALQGQAVLREVPLLLLVTTILTIIAMDDPIDHLPAMISRSDSLVMLTLISIFVYFIVIDIVRTRQNGAFATQILASPIVVPDMHKRMSWKLVFLMLLGSGLLYVGAEIAVQNSVGLASQLGVSTAVIGLLIVGVGTSAPELVASVVAATRGQSDLALGNIVGSNIFNILFVLPATGLIHVIEVPNGGVIDLVVSWLFAAALIPIFFHGQARLGRAWGGALLLAYCAYAGTRGFTAGG